MTISEILGAKFAVTQEASKLSQNRPRNRFLAEIPKMMRDTLSGDLRANFALVATDRYLHDPCRKQCLLICGPRGCGKSVAAAYWLSQKSGVLAYFSGSALADVLKTSEQCSSIVIDQIDDIAPILLKSLIKSIRDRKTECVFVSSQLPAALSASLDDHSREILRQICEVVLVRHSSEKHC